VTTLDRPMRWLQHPLTAGMNVDDPRTTELRRSIIRGKAFLSRLYEEWYELIRRNLPAGEGQVVELGAGAGFMKERIPGVITTDVIEVPGVDRVLPAGGPWPFAAGSLRAVVMTDVLHHIGDPRSLFREASRTVRSGGAIVMIEPWLTPWSGFVYRRLHSEPFRPEAEQWEFPSSGPLSGANGALPWIIFQRDRHLFEREFPEWSIAEIEPLMPFSYLLSGGVSLRSLAPGWAYGLSRALDRRFERGRAGMAMFALIKLVRIPADANGRRGAAGDGSGRPPGADAPVASGNWPQGT
jgi:SAM-dependent methyltransferase